MRVADCRDPKDDKYLELALASGADTIVSSDKDLLVLHPWRDVRVLNPADYLSSAGQIDERSGLYLVIRRSLLIVFIFRRILRRGLANRR